MDIHRSFAQRSQDGQVKREQRVDLVHDRLVRFGKVALVLEDEVVIEATDNSAAVQRILRPFRQAGGRGEFRRRFG